MKLFSSTNKSYLGVDIGSSGVRVVELRKHQNRVALATYGFSERLSSEFININKMDVAKTGAMIEDVCAKASVSLNKFVISSLPTFAVFSSIINLSQSLNKNDMGAAVNWEAKKVIPMPLEEVVVDWQKIELPAGVKDDLNTKILLTGAPKNLIKNYVNIFENIKFSLVSLETEIFGLIRSLVGNDKATLMIVQIGASTTNIFVVDNGAPIISRSIDVGGFNITEAISRQMNVDLIQAEQFKCDLANKAEGKTSLSELVGKEIAPIVNECSYVLDAFTNKENKKIERVILTGGSALLGGLSGYLTAALNTNVVVGDPWFRLAYPIELKPALEQIGPRMSVAIGLAMREFDKY